MNNGWAPENLFFLKVCFIPDVMLDVYSNRFTVTQFYIIYSNSNMSILYILKLFFSNFITTTAETTLNSCKKTLHLVARKDCTLYMYH